MISVIVPVYNVEKYIEKCVESIIAQTYTDLEIILVDDGSTDNSGKLCDEFAKSDERIRVIHKENGGLSDARNVGIDQAKGEYLAFIDSDDYIHPQMMEILYQNMQEYGADLSMCSNIEVGEKEEFHFGEIVNEVRVIDRPIEELCVNPSKIVSACTKLYHKDVLAGIRFPKGKVHEDEFVVHELLYASRKMVWTKAILYVYIKREGSITARFSMKRTKDVLEAYQARIDFFGAKCVPDMQKHSIFAAVRFMEELCLKLNDLCGSDKKQVKYIVRTHLQAILCSGKSAMTMKEKCKIAVFYIVPSVWAKYKSE